MTVIQRGRRNGGRLRLIIGTNNAHKVEEIRAILPEIEWVTPAELGIKADIDESGKTFAENALLKAKAFAALAGIPAVADDSGLETEALGGRPGVYSHRFCPWPGADDRDRRRYLIERLSAFPRPWKGRFVSCAALYDPAADRAITVFGTVDGEILDADRGGNGFGYDAIFYVPSLGKTMAEMSEAEKNAISHRGASFRALRARMIEMGILR